MPIVTLVRLLQSSNAQNPIEVTLSGMVMLVRLLHDKNALFPISVTLSGIVYDVAPHPIAKVINIPSTIKALLSAVANFP